MRKLMSGMLMAVAMVMPSISPAQSTSGTFSPQAAERMWGGGSGGLKKPAKIGPSRIFVGKVGDKLTADAPDEMKALVAKTEKDRARYIAEAQSRLRVAEDNVKIIQATNFKVHEEKIAALRDANAFAEEVRQGIATAKNALIAFERSDSYSNNVEVGWIGQLADSKVFNVIDENTAIITLVNMHPMRVGGGKQDVYLSGVSTTNWIDGNPIVPFFEGKGPLIRIVGTKKYTTAGNAARTILHAEPFDPAKFIEKR